MDLRCCENFIRGCEGVGRGEQPSMLLLVMLPRSDMEQSYHLRCTVTIVSPIPHSDLSC